jgi:hypothetical protein
MKIKFLVLAFSTLFFAACAGAAEADKSKEDEKKEENQSDAKASTGVKTAEDYFKLIAKADLKYEVLEKSADGAYAQIKITDEKAERKNGNVFDLYIWNIDANNVLFAYHEFRQKGSIGGHPIFFKFENGKKTTETGMFMEDLMTNVSEYRDFRLNWGDSKKGTKNCCLFYSFVPKSAEIKAMDVISVANDQVDVIKGRPDKFEKVGTFELVGDKFTFKKL